MGIAPEKLKEGLEAFAGDGRRQFTETVGGITIIDDSYNASPDSMAASLKVLAAKQGRRVAILGDMLELGSYEKQGHREVGVLCGELGIDVVLAIGVASYELYKALPSAVEGHYVADRAAAEEAVLSLCRPGDTVLFKASNSMNFQGLALALKERMGK
jgi:UDP-N-acetylmuramoyl-tripeptide--D-alanyl-D-alanine ligase